LERRTCWVCFATEEDEPHQRWVQPCRCKGTTKWVHNICLQRWFDEKQHGNPTVQVFCPQCNTEYLIKYPALGALHVLIDGYNKVIDKLCPVITGGLFVGCFYWTSVTLGGLTVVQVMDISLKEGRDLAEEQDMAVLFIGLPVIPWALVLTRMIRWEEWVLQLWRDHSKKWWILRKVAGDPSPEEEYPVRVPSETDAQMDFLHTTRMICGALLLPTIATACGKILFSSVRPAWKRTVCGGMTWICAKGIVHLYHKQQQYVRLARRQIEDFHEGYLDEELNASSL